MGEQNHLFHTRSNQADLLICFERYISSGLLWKAELLNKHHLLYSRKQQICSSQEGGGPRMTVFLATASRPVSHSLPCLQSTLPPRRALILLLAGHWPTKLLNLFFSFWWGTCYIAYRILVPQPGIKPVPAIVGAWNLNHWTTREVPELLNFWV